MQDNTLTAKALKNRELMYTARILYNGEYSTAY